MLVLQSMQGSWRNKGIITAAKDVCISEEINGNNTLEFKLPASDNSGISVCNAILCENERYIVEHIERDPSEGTLSVKCTHEFVFYAKRAHIPSIASTSSGDFIGEDLEKVLIAADDIVDSSSRPEYGHYYNLLTDRNYLAKLGMAPLTGSIDYEAEDKVTLWDVLEHIINNAGRGEIWYRTEPGVLLSPQYALVEQIGRETGAVISATANAKVAVEYDVSNLVTILYPYGDDGMDITGAPQNTDKKPYLASENITIYGSFVGSRDYSISSIAESGPEKLFNRALWDFDPANPDRIDVPSINISGTVTDIGLPDAIRLGDTVIVLDNGNTLKERVISIKRYPFSGRPSEVSIGRVKRDMFFYLNRLGVFTQRYKNISASNGKIYGSKVTGAVSQSASTGTAATTKALAATNIAIDSGGIRILSQGGTFLNAALNSFVVGDCIVITNGKSAVKADEISLGSRQFTVDSDGNLYFDGQKVQLIKEE